jgi:hypothetical protein
LKRGFEQLGHSVTLVTRSSHWADYDVGPEPLYAKWLRSLVGLRQRRPRRTDPLRWGLLFVELQLRWAVFLYLLCTHELFIYSAGTTFLRYADYALIRLFGKRLICQFHGSDSRPPYLNGAFVLRPEFSIERCIRRTRETKATIHKIDRLANEIIDQPPQGYFHERSFVLRFRVGFASGPHRRSAPGNAIPSHTREIRILHAPSRPAYKGSVVIREVVERLASKGHALTYVEITGQPNRTVLEEMRKCDIVVDQLYTDYPFSAVVNEAAWLGKPVITAGHAVDFWNEILSEDDLPPCVYCLPEDFQAQLELLITEAELRNDVARRLYEYVRREHHPTEVARRYLAVARGEVPDSWRFDPRRMIGVVGGFFMPEAQAKEIVRTMVSVGGVQSLWLSDKPQLERAMLQWAGVTTGERATSRSP